MLSPNDFVLVHQLDELGLCTTGQIVRAGSRLAHDMIELKLGWLPKGIRLPPCDEPADLGRDGVPYFVIPDDDEG